MLPNGDSKIEAPSSGAPGMAAHSMTLRTAFDTDGASLGGTKRVDKRNRFEEALASRTDARIERQGCVREEQGRGSIRTVESEVMT